MTNETATIVTSTKVIFYEVGLGASDRPSYMRYWQQTMTSRDLALELVKKCAAEGDLPGRMRRPMPLAMRTDDVAHDHESSGFEDQDLSIVIERGVNIYAIRLIGYEERFYSGRAKFAENPLELVGLPSNFVRKSLKLLLPDLEDGGMKGNPSKDPTKGGWLVFSCNREGLIQEIGDVFTPGNPIGDKHFQIPFRFNLIDLQTKLPIWLSGARDLNKGGGILKHHTMDHGGIHLDMDDQGDKDHGGFHPDYVSSYFYV